MKRIKLKKCNGFMGHGDYHIDGDVYAPYICREGLAGFFGVGIRRLESNIDLVVTTSKTPNSFEVTRSVSKENWWGSLLIDGKNYGMTGRIENALRAASNGADKFYVRVEV